MKNITNNAVVSVYQRPDAAMFLANDVQSVHDGSLSPIGDAGGQRGHGRHYYTVVLTSTNGQK